MSKRIKFLLGIGVIAALVLGLQIAAYAGVIGQTQGFEDDDGNLAPGDVIQPGQPSPNFDWNSFAPVNWLPSPSATPTREAVDSVNGFQFKGKEDWQASTADSAFGGGVKQDDQCAKVVTAKAPNKDDLKRIYLASKVVGGDTYLDLAWVRIPQQSTSSSAHVGFEFNQGEVACDEPPSSDDLVERTVGDILVVYDFEGGSAPPVITLRQWVTSGACEISSNSPPCWGPAQNLTAAGFAEADVNNGLTVQDALTPPALNSPTGTSVTAPLNDSEFGEAGINLSDALPDVFGPGTCNSFGTAFGVSRSSGNSGQAQMKDLVGPTDFVLSNCGTVNIIKQTDPRGLNKEFPFTSTLAGTELSCTQPAPETATSFSLNDNGNTGDVGSTDPADNSAANTQTCENVPAGSYTVTEGADPDGFTFRDATCTATGTGTSVTVNGKVASITMAGGGSVTCVYVNLEDKQSILNTEQGFIPNDTALLTGTGVTGDGTVDFRLRQGTLSDPADCGTANDTNPVVYEELNVDVGGSPLSASTSNLGGANGFTIDDTNDGPYYWEIFYDGGTDPDVLSCNEVSTVTIDNGAEVKNPPTL